MNRVGLFGQRNAPYLFAIVVSLLLSAWMSWQAGVINPDAICYLLSAQTMGTSGLTDAMKLCGQAQWPFYSMIIYAIAHVTHLSLAVSAYVINAICSAISVIFFMLIVEELGATQLTLWLAAFVILSAHHFIGVREYIIRDHGFWAAYLVSVYCLLRFFTTTQAKYAFYFSISMLLATLFRIEGIIFLALTPFITWFLNSYSLSQRAKMFLLLNLLPFCLACVGILLILFHPQHGITSISRLPTFYHQLMQSHSVIAYRYNNGKEMLIRYALPLEAASSAGAIWILTLISWYFLSIINNLTAIFTLLVIYAWIYRLPLQATSKNRIQSIALFGFIFINILITASFFVEYFFLSKRYLMALSLVLMIWVPFALNHLLMDWQDKRSRLMYFFASTIILVYALSAMVNVHNSKTYINEAGMWLAQHVPADQKIYANDLQVMYYSNHFDNKVFHYSKTDFLENNKWQSYDYIALRVNRDEQATAKQILEKMNNQLVQVFGNPRGDKVFIYKMHS